MRQLAESVRSCGHPGALGPLVTLGAAERLDVAVTLAGLYRGDLVAVVGEAAANAVDRVLANVVGTVLVYLTCNIIINALRHRIE